MKKFTRLFAVITTIMLIFSVLSVSVFAEETTGSNPDIAEQVETKSEDSAISAKAIAAAIAIGLAAFAGAIGMAIAIGKSAESIARQPEASGSIRTAMMLGLVFIETAIIYALIVAILIIFVL